MELRARTGRRRGYVAMLAVEKEYRQHGLGRRLAATGLQAMCEVCDEVRARARGRGAGPRRARVRPQCRARRARLTRPTPARSPRAQIVLETEETNTAALRLYERLGFVRDKRLPKYYLNNNDAFRLKAVLR